MNIVHLQYTATALVTGYELLQGSATNFASMLSAETKSFVWLQEITVTFDFVVCLPLICFC